VVKSVDHVLCAASTGISKKNPSSYYVLNSLPRNQLLERGRIIIQVSVLFILAGMAIAPACSVACLLISVAAILLVHLPAVKSQCSAHSCSCPVRSGCCLVVTENEPPNTVVGTYDIEPGADSYGFATGDELFEINGSGEIRTRVELDREGSYSTELSEGNDFDRNGHCFNLLLAISSGGSNLPVMVAIQVLDVNDNPPRFSQDSFTIELAESEGNSATPLACDEDSRSMFSDLIASDRDNSSSSVMYLVADNPVFSLPSADYPCVQGMALDRDVPPPSYSFTLTAQDARNSSLWSTTNVTFILTDLNDNYPYFNTSDANTSIAESLMVGGVVYRFEANDIDAELNGSEGIKYSFEDPNNIFSIDENSGTVTLLQEVNAEGRNRFTFTVIAKDRRGMSDAKSSRMDFTVFVNDINELGTVVVLPEQIPRTILEDDSLRGSSEDIIIATILLEDYDGTEENRRNVNATISVSSDCDRNSNIYRCSHFYVNSSFSSLPNLYRFQLWKNGTLDREQEPFIFIVVNITEGGNPTLYHAVSLNLTIEDVNDNAPKLSRTSFSVKEENSFTIDLSDYTCDQDSGTNGAIANFSLVSAKSGNKSLTERLEGWLLPDGLLSPTSGSEPLDREEDGRIITFVVSIADAGLPSVSSQVSFSLIVEDENDNPPAFQLHEYTFPVQENDLIGTAIGKVVAMDPDVGSGSVRYSISPPSHGFSIDQETGQLLTNKSFDREQGDSIFQLSVVATDGLLQSETTVIIPIQDVNDNDPYFPTEIFFSVKTSLVVGGLVGQLVAKDNDSTAENSVIVYQIQDSPTFSINHNTSGNVTLKTVLLEPDRYTFSVAVFNPGREEFNSTVTVTVVVEVENTLNMTFISVIAATGIFFAVLIIIVSLLLAFVFWKNKKSRRQLKLQEEAQRLNNMQTSILKLPASAPTTNGYGAVGSKSSRVTFKERVEETHYDEETSVINSTTSTIKKESVTKFDGSPQVRHDEEGYETLTPMPLSPMSSSSSPNGKSGHPLVSAASGTIAVVDLEMSPRQGMNGDINGRCQFSMHPRRSPPIPRMAPGGGSTGAPRGHTTAAEMMGYSQGTSSDGHTSVHELDDESMYSDDASIVNTPLSRFSNGRPDISSYDGSSAHAHMELHRHLPPISHNQHPHSSSLAQLHAFNLAQLAKTNSTEARSRYSPMLSPDDNDLTPNDEDTIRHTNTISTQSSLHHTSSTTPINHAGLSAGSNHEHVNGGRSYAHPPPVMPDAFPRDTPEVHRFPMGSFVEYGDASTYASTELDEALGFNEMEPGIISLTATTDYDDTQL